MKRLLLPLLLLSMMSCSETSITETTTTNTPKHTIIDIPKGNNPLDILNRFDTLQTKIYTNRCDYYFYNDDTNGEGDTTEYIWYVDIKNGVGWITLSSPQHGFKDVDEVVNKSMLVKVGNEYGLKYTMGDFIKMEITFCRDTIYQTMSFLSDNGMKDGYECKYYVVDEK